MKSSHIYGIHSLIEALRAGRQIEKIFFLKNSQNERLKELKEIAEKKRVPLQAVPMERLDQLEPTGKHQNAIAVVAEVVYQDFEEVLLATREAEAVPLFILLDGITDVRNIGAIARTAECMGAHGLILPVSGSGSLNADAVKVSAGALHHLPICRVTTGVDAVQLAQAYGLSVICFTEKSKQTIFEADFRIPICIVLGSEEKGISPAILKSANQRLRIPMEGKIASLNVSVSAGMALYETLRQRQTID
jgi:23S rRNA (guanosine2251-2'-O)-methyltransferase